MLKKFALTGYPLGHSLSAAIQKAGFESLGIQAEYDLLETPPETLIERIKTLKRENYSGFNVTIPLKLPVVLFVDEIDRRADITGAVNTITINPDKTMKGYNTDVIGFKKAIPNTADLIGKKVGILGTGGAARAAVTALCECNVKQIAFYTRNIPNSLELLNYLRKTFPDIEFSTHQIEAIRDLSDLTMLVNATPIGMLGVSADMTPVELPVLKTLPRDATVYDVIYNPKKTVLLKNAERLGLKTINGLDMLIYQAVGAQEIWFNRTPDFKAMKLAALENF